MKYLSVNPHENGGIGHQFLNWKVGAVLAKKWDLGFVHTPLISERSGGNWNSFLHLGDGYKNKVSLSRKKLPDLDLGHVKGWDTGEDNLKRIKDIVMNGPDNMVYSFPRNTFPGVVSKDLSLLVNDLRRKYRKVNSVDIKRKFHVSFHIRRGDVDPNQNANRWESDEFYIQWMNKIRNYLGRKNINHEIHLFSTTGSYTRNFNNYPDFVTQHIDGDPFEDFKFMTDSDVLFCGLSSYSILAAVYNIGFSFYTPIKHKYFCAWMEDQKNPRVDKYSNAYNSDLTKFKNWFAKNYE